MQTRMRYNKQILTLSAITICLISFGQAPGWQHKDLQKDGIFGISTERAYSELLGGKTAKTVIVAIIDSGIDTMHEDLENVLWTKSDGSHGWNYIGQETGKEDIAQLVAFRKDFYDSLSYTSIPEIYRADYQAHRKIEPILSSKIEGMKSLVSELMEAQVNVRNIITKIGKQDPDLSDFYNYQPRTEGEGKLLKLIIDRLPKYASWRQCQFYEIDHLIDLAQCHLKRGLNINSSSIDSNRGNTDVSPDVEGLIEHPNWTPLHGTHVAGIIGAVRCNGIGIDGIADHVQLMMLKINGNIRELRDKNLSDAIYYAVDNGAKIINMSFGKLYSWEKRIVDNAVRYAMKHDVLIVHAAGNDGMNIDNISNFPSPIYMDIMDTAEAWIQVGASRPFDDSIIVAAFSNYGGKSVDVFAPGTGIYSTIPGSKYELSSGTSMAAPVVSGVAALIREYYPALTAVQVKRIIMESVVKVNHKIYVLGNNGELRFIPFENVCVSGGIVNAYNALKLAAGYR